MDGKQYDGTPFSLFLPREYTKSDQAPTGGYTAPGWVKATVVKRQGDLVLVLLPRATFQNGPYVTVRPEQLESGVAPAAKAARQGNASQ